MADHYQIEITSRQNSMGKANTVDEINKNKPMYYFQGFIMNFSIRHIC